MHEKLLATTGQRLRVLRLRRGLNQLEMAAELKKNGVKVGKSYLSQIENDPNGRTPSGHIVAAMAQVLNTTTDYLLLMVDDPRPVQQGRLHPEIWALVERLNTLGGPTLTSVARFLQAIADVEIARKEKTLQQAERALDELDANYGDQARTLAETAIRLL